MKSQVFLETGGRGESQTDSREGHGDTEADTGVMEPMNAADSHQKRQETNSFLECPGKQSPVGALIWVQRE